MTRIVFASEEERQDKSRFGLPGLPTGISGLSWVSWLSVAFLLFYVAFSLAAPVLAPFPPDEIFVGGTFDPPSSDFWLGTDGLGRDIYSRLLFGGRTVLWTAAAASGLSVAIGGFLGTWLGYRGGRLDEIAMRILEIAMSIPPVIFALLILGLVGSSSGLVVVTVGLLFVPNVARVTRAATLAVVEEDFIAAARARGESSIAIVARELLPNVAPTVGVEFAVRTGFAILFIAGLGFLGFGAAPPDPDWGLMINEGRSTMQDAPWLVAAPAIGIALLVTAINLLTDALIALMGPQGHDGGRQ